MKRKLPHFRFPGSKILDRYIPAKFLSTYFFAIGMIIVVVVIFDYVEKIDNFTETKAPLKAIIFDYYLNFIPFFINQFSGLFTFIAVIFFTSKMAYQTEIVAMLSGGMSFRRLMWPYFLSAAAITLLSLGLNLYVIPAANGERLKFEMNYIKRNKGIKYDQHIYRQIEPGTFAYIRGYNGGARQASGRCVEGSELWLLRRLGQAPRSGRLCRARLCHGRRCGPSPARLARCLRLVPYRIGRWLRAGGPRPGERHSAPAGR